MKLPLAIVLFCVSLISTAGARHAAGQQIDKAPNNPAAITVDGKTITLNDAFAKRLQRIRSRGVVVFYPAYVPDRFRLASVTVARCEDSAAYLDYSLRFCDRSHLCFSIESACSGIGSAPDGDKSFTGRSKGLGPFRLERFNPDLKTKGDKVYYLSEWMPEEKMVIAEKKGPYRASNGGRYHHFLGYGISDKEAVAIVQSLSRLR